MYIESLFERFKDGDAYAFDDLVVEYKNNLILFITRFINSVPLAESIAKEAFIELYRNKDKFEDGSHIKAYLCAYARYRAISLKKSPEARANDNDPINANDLIELENTVLTSEEQRFIVDSMKGLDDDYKTVLYLVYIEEMSYSEVGRVLRTDKERVKDLVAKAKTALKNNI